MKVNYKGGGVEKEAIAGNVYRNKEGELYLCARMLPNEEYDKLTLVRLRDGAVWNSKNVWGAFSTSKDWTDVTSNVEVRGVQ